MHRQIPKGVFIGYTRPIDASSVSTRCKNKEAMPRDTVAASPPKTGTNPNRRVKIPEYNRSAERGINKKFTKNDAGANDPKCRQEMGNKNRFAVKVEEASPPTYEAIPRIGRERKGEVMESVSGRVRNTIPSVAENDI